jgi:Co/Zn/Cd efflux system component
MATHQSTLQRWRHEHDFLPDRSAAERSTTWVMLLTGATMVVEIVGGVVSGSMALLADGWHMGTHVAAFAITIFAYRYARQHRDDPRFTFGTGKVTELGGFASALALAFVALLAGKFAGWTELDPVMGIVGALLILRWARGLARTTAAVLLDGVAHEDVREQIRGALERHPDAVRRGDSIADLHIWAVGPNRLAVSLAIVADDPDTPAAYRRRLADLHSLAHVVVEVNRCDDPLCRKEPV